MSLRRLAASGGARKRDPGLELTDIVIFGPEGSILKNQRIKEQTSDKFLLPQGVWPTDHKGVLATFCLKF